MRFAGGIDIGGSSTKIGIVAINGNVVVQRRIPTSVQGAPEPLVRDITNAFKQMLAENPQHSVDGIGVSVAGFMNPDHTAMIHNANLPALREFPLKRALEEALGIHCMLEVDSNATTLAEYHYGVGKNGGRLLGITVGTGIGGGVVLDRKLLRYTGECAGDIGHVIVDPSGRQCTCGARGCMEAMGNAASLSERAGGRTVKDVIERAMKGDTASRAALAETGKWIGLGIASLAPLFDPDTIVVGGGLAAARDHLIDPVRDAYNRYAAPQYTNAKVLGSLFDGWDGLVGAASLFLAPLS